MACCQLLLLLNMQPLISQLAIFLRHVMLLLLRRIHARLPHLTLLLLCCCCGSGGGGCLALLPAQCSQPRCCLLHG